MNESVFYVNKRSNYYTISLRNFMFYLAYTLLFVKEIILDRSRIYDLIGSNITGYLSTLSHIGFLGLCLFILLFMQKYTIKEFILIIVLVPIFILSAHYSGISTVFDTLLIILCSKEIDFEGFIKYSLMIHTVCILMVFTLAFTGLIGVGTVLRGTGKVRYALGFIHPNTPGLLCFQWVCQYLYIKRNNEGIKRFLISLICIAFVYKYTNSNTAVLMTILVIVCEFIYEKVIYKVFNQKMIKRMIRTVLVVIVIGVIAVIRYYWNNPDKLDATTVVARINLAKKYLEAYGIKLFGQSVVSGNNTIIPGFQQGNYYLDNAFAWLLIRMGILVTLIVIVAYVLYIKRLLSEKNWSMIIIVVAYLAYALSENITIRIVFNATLLGFGTIIYNKVTKTDNKKEEKNDE